MKTKILIGAAALLGALLTFSARADSPFTERDARINAAVAASPRAREVFPWLTRTPTASARAVTNAELKNTAYAKSPRVLELYPELSRSGEAAQPVCVPVPQLSNRGYAASPRAKEMFPHLRVNSADVPACGACVAVCECCG